RPGGTRPKRRVPPAPGARGAWAPPASHSAPAASPAVPGRWVPCASQARSQVAARLSLSVVVAVALVSCGPSAAVYRPVGRETHEAGLRLGRRRRRHCHYLCRLRNGVVAGGFSPAHVAGDRLVARGNFERRDDRLPVHGARLAI